jgi:folylpolyglutamate synthase
VFKRLAASLKGSSIQHAIFTTYERDNGSSRQLYYFLYTSLANSRLVLQCSHGQHVYAEIWKGLHPNSTVLFEPTIQGALEKVRGIGKEHGTVQTLVTGSQHLVGGALSLLGSSPA